MEFSSVANQKEAAPISEAKKPSGFYTKLTQLSLSVLFFLLPPFFLPFTSEAVEMNKQTLLLLCTTLALVGWLGGMVAQKQVLFKKGWFQLLPVGFLAVLGGSCIFSLANYRSWVGGSMQEYTSFLTQAALVILFLILYHGAGTRAFQNRLFAVSGVSAIVTGLISLAALFHLLPARVIQMIGFNTVGTMHTFLFMLVGLMGIGLTAWLTLDTKLPKRTLLFTRLLLLSLAFITLFLLVAVDFWLLWAVVIGMVLTIVAIGFVRSNEFEGIHAFFLPLIILAFGVLFLVIKTPINIPMPTIVSPSYSASFSIARHALTSSIPHLFFGTGPGTFVQDYARFHAQEINATAFWNTNFDRAKSHLLTLLATTGVLGVIVWLAMMGILGAAAFNRVLVERDSDEWRRTAMLCVGWLTFVVVHLVYSSNLTLQFFLWATSGLLAANVWKNEWTSQFGKSPRAALVAAFGFVFATVSSLTVLFVAGQRYSAEIAFARALSVDQSKGSVDDVLKPLITAASRNPFDDRLFRNVALASFVRATQVVNEAGDKKLSDEQAKQAKQFFDISTNASAAATSLEPNEVNNWTIRGLLYRDLMNFAPDAQNVAVPSFLRAAELEPKNPEHMTNIGRVYLTLADRARQLTGAEDKTLAEDAKKKVTENLKTAEDYFGKALALKADYAPAHYQIAAVYERQGKLKEASDRLAALRSIDPYNVGLGFQLGLLYMNTKQLDQAQAEFERILSLSPKYSNAMWYLASVAELKKDREKAISLVEQVVELNPESSVAKDRLKKLKAGQTTTRLPEPLEEEVKPVESDTTSPTSTSSTNEDTKAGL